jgi:hypothetical protein
VIGAAGLAGGAVLWFAEPTQQAYSPRFGAGLGSFNAKVAF